MMSKMGSAAARRVIAIVILAGLLLSVGVGLVSAARAQIPELPLPIPTDDEQSPAPQPTPSGEPQPEPDDDSDDYDDYGQEPETIVDPFPSESVLDGSGDSDDMIDGDAVIPGPTSAPAADGRDRSGVSTPQFDPVAAALPGVFGLSLAALVAATGLGGGMVALAKRGLFAVRGEDGGINVEATKRWRLLGGLGLLGVAALVGVLGWLKISLETQVAVQVVYLASTGFAVLVLAVAGGSLLIAEQLRADERRMREVEDALVNLAGQVQPLVSEPARIIKRKAGKAFDPDITTEIG